MFVVAQDVAVVQALVQGGVKVVAMITVMVVMEIVPEDVMVVLDVKALVWEVAKDVVQDVLKVAAMHAQELQFLGVKYMNDIIYGTKDDQNLIQVLRDKIEAEFNRRNITDTINGTHQINNSGLDKFLAPDFATQALTDNFILSEHGEKTINLINQCKNNSVPEYHSGDEIPDVTRYIEIVNDLTSRPLEGANHGCSLICVGLCSGACYNGCNGCWGSL